ncbi:MAG: leucine-rich repeat domain-containing protein, partial [Tyzzerella sp.]|nr:leucine-rich repeat domain-containing protein [Tyzzerella sp.]
TKKQHVTSKDDEKIEEEDSTEMSEDVGSYEHPLDSQEEGVIGKTIIANGNAVVLIGENNQKVYGKPASQVTEGAVDEASTEVESVEEESTEETTESEKLEKDSKEEVLEEENAKEEQDKNTSHSQIIKERQYYKQKSLTKYEISETIKEIGRLSFARSGLTTIKIPDCVRTIGYGAFYACEDLKEVIISDKVTAIETKAFADTPWLKNWLSGEESGDGSDFLVVGDGILLAYRGTGSKVEIPKQVKQIGSEAFKGHEELIEVTIPDRVTRINAEAFRDCKKLKTVNGCKGVKTIIRGAFYGTQVDEESLKSK